MSNITIYRTSNLIRVQEVGKPSFHVPLHNVGMIDLENGNLSISYWPLDSGKNQWRGTVSEVFDINGEVYGTEFVDILQGYDNGTDVNIQDQHTPLVITNFTNLESQTVTTAPIAKDDLIVPVADVGTAIIGDDLTIFDINSLRFTQFRIIAINALNITIDGLMDFDYPVGSFVDIGNSNLAVNGAVTPVIFGIRNPPEAPPLGIKLSFDVTRIIFSCITDTAVDLIKFGDLAALTNGLMLRSTDGECYNIFNIKSNGGLANICYDFDVSAATNPNQGQDGFSARLTFAGQNKMGVVVRLKVGEDLQLVVRDNLTGLQDLSVIAEGHIVEEN